METVAESEDEKLTENNLVTFDDVLKIVGDNGKFQRYFNWVFNFSYTFILCMIYLNHVLAVATPEHWCHVPGRPNNVTIDEWRTLTIPPDINTKDKETFSGCYMYKNPLKLNESNAKDIISCQYGWEYNKTWYDETFTSAENWVCDKSYFVVNSLTVGRFGDFFGTFLSGYFGDIVGRRPIFIIAVIGTSVSRILMLFTKFDYYIFMVVSFFSYITLNGGYQSPLTIILEISPVERRATVALIHHIGWILGETVMPLIMWAVRRVDYFIVLTSVPGLFVLLIFRYLIESPRWLLSQRKTKRCYKQLQVIAKINNKKLPADLLLKLEKIADSEQLDRPSRNISNLFSHWRVAKNTIITCICWSVSFLCSQILIYYIEILEGNPFLNFFIQGVIQVPGSIIAQKLCDRYGRRFALLVGHSGTILATFAIILLIKDSENVYTPAILAAVIKFFSTMVFTVVNLQSLEIYPTGMRQTGSSFCIVCGLALTVSVPYIASLGKTYDARYPYLIVLITFILSGISGTFLPETRGNLLPETLDEARAYGAKQSYFNFFNQQINKNRYNKKNSNEI